MESINLYKLKHDIQCVVLENEIIQNILDCYVKSNIKMIKTSKKQINIMKTNKIQAKKDLNENKLIMIMNKISNDNINELIAEYISNININSDNYNVILTEIFNKMVKDIKFIENYINFSIKIFAIEYKRLNINPSLFIDLIKDTLNESTEETVRSACYEIIKQLQKCGFFHDNILSFISKNLFSMNSTNCIDIYNWFSSFPKEYIYKYKDDIMNILSHPNMITNNRDKILISSLLEDHVNNESQDILDEEENDEFKTLIGNILEEYNFIKSVDEVEEFIKTECNDINKKNIFCREFIEFNINNVSTIDMTLIDTLIRNKVLFKSNISKGLVLYLSNNQINKNDERNDKIIDVLKYLKQNNITKNIEHIFKKFRVKLFYDN
jgi:hypothetical protein